MASVDDSDSGITHKILSVNKNRGFGDAMFSFGGVIDFHLLVSLFHRSFIIFFLRIKVDRYAR